MKDQQYIENSILCFMNSSKDDVPAATALDMIISFYSHEEIKKAKELLCNLLKTDIVWRRDPDKKLKDARDVFEFYEKVSDARMKVEFVTASHKSMPPVGFEIFAPLLKGLADDVKMMNEILPKILDMKTEVYNTADTVRTMRAEMSTLNNKFCKAIGGIEEASKDITVKSCGLDDLLSLTNKEERRLSLKLTNKEKSNKQNEKNYADVLRSRTNARDNSPEGNDRRFEPLIGATALPVFDGSDTEELDNDNLGTKSQDQQGKHSIQEQRKQPLGQHVLRKDQMNSRKEHTNIPRGDERQEVFHDRNGRDQWNQRSNSQSENYIKGGSRPKSTPVMSSPDGHVKKVDKLSEGWKEYKSRNAKRREYKGILGKKSHENLSIKAVTRYLDVFIGRVDPGVTMDDLIDYIRKTFNISVVNIAQLEIRSDNFIAFKVTVKAMEREKLFNTDMWPEDLIVDKFYNKSKKIMELSSITYNCCSLRKNIDIVRQLCLDKYDLIFLQESYVTEDKMGDINYIDESYECVGSPAIYSEKCLLSVSGRCQGGLVCMWRKHLPIKVIAIEENYIVLQLSCNGIDNMLVNVYIRSVSWENESLHAYMEGLQDLEDILTNYRFNNVFLLVILMLTHT